MAKSFKYAESYNSNENSRPNIETPSLSECMENAFFSNIEDQKDEVLALQAIFEDTEKLSILSFPLDSAGINTLGRTVELDSETCNTSGVVDADTKHHPSTCVINQYHLRLLVPVDQDGNIQVEAWIPYECASTTQQAAAQLAPLVKPQFERSESGRRWHSSFELSHLTPLILEVSLPPSYPSHDAPSFTLSCLWLSASQLSSLCRQLDKLWQESLGMPVIYTWIHWLQSNTLTCLGIEKSIILIPYVGNNLEESEDIRDPRAIPECTDIQEDLVTLLRYDSEQEEKEFMQTRQMCEICFEEKPGSDFFRLKECYHHFCNDCLTGYCEMHVGEGTVQQLSCPAQECKTSLPPAILRAVLGEAAYSRWERLLLQNTLSTMGDVEWCPRCNHAVIREEEDSLNLAYCTSCSYAFCTNCHESWHQGRKCLGVAEKLKELEEETKKVERDTDCQHARRMREEYLSKMTVRQTSKQCPKCHVPIEKNYGCNKVTCTQCGSSLCWECGRRISGYEHFREEGKCTLFVIEGEAPRYHARPVVQQREMAEEGLRVQHMLLVDQDAHNRVVVCKRCSQRNLKERRNNHVRCWSCKTNMCAMCHQLITGPITSHYMAGMPCQQHS